MGRFRARFGSRRRLAPVYRRDTFSTVEHNLALASLNTGRLPVRRARPGRDGPRAHESRRRAQHPEHAARPARGRRGLRQRWDAVDCSLAQSLHVANTGASCCSLARSSARPAVGAPPWSSEGVDRGCVPSLPRDCPPKDADLYAVNTMHEYYQNLAFGTRALPPHIFAIASDAYRALLLHGTSQSIVTSGESGSGTRWPVRHGRWVAVGKG